MTKVGKTRLRPDRSGGRLRRWFLDLSRLPNADPDFRPGYFDNVFCTGGIVTPLSRSAVSRSGDKDNCKLERAHVQVQ